MKAQEAAAVIVAMHGYVQGRYLKATIEGDRVVFTGGRSGGHSLWLDASSAERVQAHWEGYVEANTDVPRVGDLVRFPSASAPGGMRKGRVVKVGPKRAVVAYRFKHGGQAAPRAVPFADLRAVAW